MTRFPKGEENPIPAKTAKSFAGKMLKKGYKLDFSLESLDHEVDQILASPHIQSKGIDLNAWKIQSGLEAYVGQTLAELFDGIWKGDYSLENSGLNFYTSYVAFGAYRFYPSHFIAYRISNGEVEGSFKDYLTRTLPKIKARVEND